MEADKPKSFGDYLLKAMEERRLIRPVFDFISDGDRLVPVERRRHLKHPGEFAAICDRCKLYKDSCLLVPYNVPPLLTPPETEPLIGPDYITERVVMNREDMRIPHAAMCYECRVLKQRAGVERARLE